MEVLTMQNQPGEKSRTPALTVIIPSIGYSTLTGTLESIATQELFPDDQVFVVGDGPQPESEARLREVGARFGCGRLFQYREIPLTKNWGNPNRNFVLASGEVRLGNLLAWMDEDDIFLPGAFATLRQRAVEAEGHPFMVRGIWPDGRVLWWAKGAIQCGLIGGHNFVTPYLPDRVGRWGTTYEGDFDFIRSTLDLWGDDAGVRWYEDLISDHRPHLKRREPACA